MNVLLFTTDYDVVYELTDAHVEEGVIWGWTDEQHRGVPLWRVTEIIVTSE